MTDSDELARALAALDEERARTAKLEEECARLQAVVRQIPAGLMIVGPTGRVVVANDDALRILRVRSHGLEDGDAVWQAWRPDGTPYAPGEWPSARSLRTGEHVAGERAEVLRGDGVRIVIEISTAPVRDPAGRLIGAVAVFQDVTTRERQERSEREFVTNAAHELQSPLAAIVSAIEVLQAGAKDSEERDVFLGHIEREADRLAQLARALLTLARAQIGRDEPRTEVVQLEPLLRGVAESLHPRAGVTVAIECAADAAVVTNRELLEQALANLAHNAEKNTTSGRIVLAARAVDGRVELSVGDTGPGIAAVERPRVFRRFYRSGEPRGEGFGLGLAIVQAAVEALGAELELDSTVGEGTTVRITVPAAARIVS